MNDHWHLVLPGVSQTMRDGALATVKQAAGQFSDNSQRRGWAVDQMMRMFGLPESIARLLVEIALFLLKRDTTDASA